MRIIGLFIGGILVDLIFFIFPFKLLMSIGFFDYIFSHSILLFYLLWPAVLIYVGLLTLIKPLQLYIWMGFAIFLITFKFMDVLSAGF